jgi:hypothetical protein
VVCTEVNPSNETSDSSAGHDPKGQACEQTENSTHSYTLSNYLNRINLGPFASERRAAPASSTLIPASLKRSILPRRSPAEAAPGRTGIMNQTWLKMAVRAGESW